jgi:hypothetical protein
MKMHDMTSLAVLDPGDAAPSPRQLRIRPWEDPVLDRQGHDPRSAYAETFWLPLLGPSATFLARRLASRFDEEPAGFALPADDAARSLGLGHKQGRRSPFNRTVGRLVQFRLLHLDAEDVILARRRFPGLSRTQVSKLPASLQEAHEAYKTSESAAPALPVMRERARSLALTFLELGETPEEVLAHLHRLRFDPPLRRQALAWAIERHEPGAATGESPGLLPPVG